MKSKLLLVSLFVILLFSVLSVASATVQCPRCHGTGKIPSQICPICGGSGVIEPTITLKRTFAGASGPHATFVEGVFQNEENVGAYGIATAQVKTPTATYTNTSARTYFPPHEDVTVTIIVEEIAYESYWSCLISLSEVEDITCPDCGGTGGGSGTIDCPDCGGTGFITAREDVTDFLNVGGVIGGVAVVAVVVIAAVVIVKRKKVTEKDLRKLPPSEFQNWVVQRLSGKVSSQKDSYTGIDGHTVEGYPIQAKQLDNVGSNIVDSFATAIGRSKAKTGVIVAFSFGNDVIRGIVRAKLHYGLEIKTVTVKELIESNRIY